MFTVQQIQQVLTTYPADQRIMLIDEDGLARDIEGIDPFTVYDHDDTQILTLEFILARESYGFSGDIDRIDTR